MKPSPITALAIGAAAVTVALTGVAFWLSYEHLHDVADGNGLTGAEAWAWPACLDLFIVAGELLMLRASLQRRIDGWAIALAASGSLGSIALNVAGVGADAALLEYVVAAVPPVAALLAFGALMRQVHQALAGHTAPVPVSAPEPEHSLVLDLPALHPYPHPEVCAPAPVAALDTTPRRTRVHAPVRPAPDDRPVDPALLDRARQLPPGPKGVPSIRVLKTELRVGQEAAQCIQNALKTS